MSAAQNMVDFYRGFGERRKAARVDDALRNYLTDPDQTIAAVQQIDPRSGIALQANRVAEQRAVTEAADKARVGKANAFAQITGYLRAQPEGTDYGATIDGMKPFLMGALGMGEQELETAKAAIVANPSVITALDEKANEARAKAEYGDTVVTPGSAYVRGGVRQFSQPFAPQVKVIPDGRGGNTVLQFDPNTGENVGAVPGAAPAGGPLPGGRTGAPPISVRNNNPGALRDDGRSKWRGATGSQGGFLTFDTPENGRRAQIINIMNQKRLHGINTLTDLVVKYAPSSDGNDPAAYAGTIARALGVNPGDPINLADPAIAGRVADAMAMVESGGHVNTVQGNGPVNTGGTRTIATNPGIKVPEGYRLATAEELKGYPAGTQAQVNIATGKLENLRTPPAGVQSAARKTAEAYLKDDTRTAALSDMLTDLANNAQAVLNTPDLDSYLGNISGRMPGILSSGRNDLYQTLETLKGQIGINVLQTMREMSKTGGALGQVSNYENKILQRALGNLETSQSPAQFKKNVQTIISIVQRTKRRMAEALIKQRQVGGGAQPQAAPTQGGGMAPGTIIRNPTTGERRQWNGRGWVNLK